MGLLGREGVLLKGGSPVGSLKNISLGASADLIKDYVMGSDEPDTLASGNKSYKISIEKLYVDKTLAEDLINGTALEIKVHPEGTGSTLPEITLTGVVLNSWDFDASQDGIIGENVSGEAKTLAFGTQT